MKGQTCCPQQLVWVGWGEEVSGMVLSERIPSQKVMHLEAWSRVVGLPGAGEWEEKLVSNRDRVSVFQNGKNHGDGWQGWLRSSE